MQFVSVIQVSKGFGQRCPILNFYYSDDLFLKDDFQSILHSLTPLNVYKHYTSLNGIQNSGLYERIWLRSLAGFIRFLWYGKKENLNLFNVTGLLTFCFQTEMSPTKTCQNLIIPSVIERKIKENDEHFCILLFQHTLKPVHSCLIQHCWGDKWGFIGRCSLYVHCTLLALDLWPRLQLVA